MVEFAVYAIAMAAMAGFGWLVYRQLAVLRAARQNAQSLLMARLAAPDWAAFGAHLQRAVAPEFIQLYEQFALASATREFDLGDGLVLIEFFPLDAQALVEQPQFHLASVPFDYLPFASGTAEDWFLKPGAMAANQIFAVHRHSGEWHELGLNPEQLLQRIQASTG